MSLRKAAEKVIVLLRYSTSHKGSGGPNPTGQTHNRQENHAFPFPSPYTCAFDRGRSLLGAEFRRHLPAVKLGRLQLSAPIQTRTTSTTESKIEQLLLLCRGLLLVLLSLPALAKGYKRVHPVPKPRHGNATRIKRTLKSVKPHSAYLQTQAH